MEQTVCSEMLAYKIQTPGNYPEESIRRLDCLRYKKYRVSLDIDLADYLLSAESTMEGHPQS